MRKYSATRRPRVMVIFNLTACSRRLFVRQTTVGSLLHNLKTFSSSRIMSVSKEHIEQKLSKELEPAHLVVEDISGGCGSSFSVMVVSQKFEGKSLLQRQRLVNTLLAEELKEIHALNQKTLTPEQWEKQKS